MDRTTTTPAFMRGFFKVAYANGLSVEEAAELHAEAILTEACSRSPEFAQGLYKAASARAWWNPFSWGSSSAQQPPRRQQPSYHPVQMPVTDTHRGRHSHQFVQEQQTKGKSPERAQQSADNVMRGRNAIHQSHLRMKPQPGTPHNMSQQPVKLDLKGGGALGTLLKPEGATELDFQVRPPIGLSGARG